MKGWERDKNMSTDLREIERWQDIRRSESDEKILKNHREKERERWQDMNRSEIDNKIWKAQEKKTIYEKMRGK